MRDDDPEPAMEDWEPERYVLCKDADGCLEWQSHPGPHTREMRTARAREIAFEESKGLDPTMPRHKMPSRIDRSAEYARRNRARRHGLRG